MDNPYLHDLLTRVWEYLDDRADVMDGDYGEPRPNKAMSLAQDVQAAIDELETCSRCGTVRIVWAWTLSREAE